jgi:hypothetical protein
LSDPMAARSSPSTSISVSHVRYGVASIHPSMYCVTRGCGVVPEPEGELRSLKNSLALLRYFGA